jgi:hypothetical protein
MQLEFINKFQNKSNTHIPFVVVFLLSPTTFGAIGSFTVLLFFFTAASFADTFVAATTDDLRPTSIK